MGRHNLWMLKLVCMLLLMPAKLPKWQNTVKEYAQSSFWFVLEIYIAENFKL